MSLLQAKKSSDLALLPIQSAEIRLYDGNALKERSRATKANPIRKTLITENSFPNKRPVEMIRIKKKAPIIKSHSPPQ